MTMEFTRQHTLGPQVINQRDGVTQCRAGILPCRDGGREGWREPRWLPSSLAPTLNFCGSILIPPRVRLALDLSPRVRRMLVSWHTGSDYRVIGI